MGPDRGTLSVFVIWLSLLPSRALFLASARTRHILTFGEFLRQDASHRQTGMVVEQFHGCAMQAHDRGHQTQPQTAAGLSAIALQADERLENAFPFFARYARTVVSDRQRDGIALADCNLNPSSGRNVLQCVLDQVHQCLRQQLLIAAQDSV